MVGAILKATNSFFQKGMIFCRRLDNNEKYHRMFLDYYNLEIRILKNTTDTSKIGNSLVLLIRVVTFIRLYIAHGSLSI